MEVNIENHTELVGYLRATGRIKGAAPPIVSLLPGGVSNRTVRIEHTDGTAWVLKQALPKLRVTDDWFCDPRRVEREALGLQWLERLVPEHVPQFVFEDRPNHLFAMTAVPQPHANWKMELMAGRSADEKFFRQFGELLARIHRLSRDPALGLRSIFDDRTFFEALRIDPYYRAAGRRHPAAGEFYDRLIAETAAVQETLVHGDFSPKNVLVREGRLILLDFEVIHFGDPAFDLGFSLTHLLSKVHHLNAHRKEFVEAAKIYWASYAGAFELREAEQWEERAVRHTLGCLLARIDGRSPLEYLTPPERDRQRMVSTELMQRSPRTIPELIEAFTRQLTG